MVEKGSKFLYSKILHRQKRKGSRFSSPQKRKVGKDHDFFSVSFRVLLFFLTQLWFLFQGSYPTQTNHYTWSNQETIAIDPFLTFKFLEGFFPFHTTIGLFWGTLQLSDPPPKKNNQLHHPGVQLSELSFRVNGNTLDLTGAVASNDGGTNPSNEGGIYIFFWGVNKTSGGVGGWLVSSRFKKIWREVFIFPPEKGEFPSSESPLPGGNPPIFRFDVSFRGCIPPKKNSDAKIGSAQTPWT